MTDATLILLAKLALLAFILSWVKTLSLWFKRTGIPFIQSHKMAFASTFLIASVLAAMLLIVGYFHHGSRLKVQTALISQHSKVFSQNTKIIDARLKQLGALTGRLDKQGKSLEEKAKRLEDQAGKWAKPKGGK